MDENYLNEVVTKEEAERHRNVKIKSDNFEKSRKKMDDLSMTEWKSHIRSIIIQNMRYNIDALSHEDLPDHIFNFMIQGLQNGIIFLTNENNQKNEH